MGIDVLASAVEIGPYNASAKVSVVKRGTTSFERVHSHEHGDIMSSAPHAKILACRSHGASRLEADEFSAFPFFCTGKKKTFAF